ncbi:MAG: 50S ribosomal protein L17 [Chlamydiae bacterium CG10_big_fil_rev_8_21_14_0_10_35_9]|nr:MAG: 50S ribosomal protein L17 [Chlamydiae bacterium CG10_big_fil_rev_8_21_14_0_10_35_9]
MRHAKRKYKLGRTGSHKRAMIANMLKDLIDHERIETSLIKAKELKRHADKMITLAKKDTLASKRMAISKLRLQYNHLTPKEARKAKDGDTSAYNTDRKVLNKLFALKQRYETREGGYTRIIRKSFQVGDSSPTCILEYI